MKKTVQIFLMILLSLILVTGCQQQNSVEKEKVKDGIFIHISHGTDDPHRVVMALSMAGMMSETRDVLVYFDIKGVDVVLKDSPNIKYKHFPASKDQLKKLMDKGITIMACPGCLKAAGKTPEDLMEGVQVADKDKFFTFTKGRIFTIDY